MDAFHLSARGISLSLDLSVGHIAGLVIEQDGRSLTPLHRAPWIGAPEWPVPDQLPDGVKRLSGDFLCAPFSRSDIEDAPLHGWPANSPWDVVSERAIDGGSQATLRLRRHVMGAVVEKTLTLRDGHPFVYQEHVFDGGNGFLPAAHHVMTEMRAGGRLAFSAKRLALTPPAAPEPDPARGRSRLAYPASAEGLESFPLAAGGSTDLTDYAAGTSSEDFVMLVEADHAGIGWSAVSRVAEGDLVLVLKDPRILPVTMLWLSNGGRDYAPWNGRAGVLGIEDGRTAIGHAESLGENILSRQGVATAFELGRDRRVSLRHVIGATQALPSGEAPSAVMPDSGNLRLVFSGGEERRLAFDADFLRAAAD